MSYRWNYDSRSRRARGELGQPRAMWGEGDFSPEALKRMTNPKHSRFIPMKVRTKLNNLSRQGAARQAIVPPPQPNPAHNWESDENKDKRLIKELMGIDGLDGLTKEQARAVLDGAWRLLGGGQKSRKKCKARRRKHSRRKHSSPSRRKHKGTKRRRTHRR